MDDITRKKVIEATDLTIDHVLKTAVMLGEHLGSEASREFLKLMLTVLIGQTVKYSLDYPYGMRAGMTKEERHALTERSYMDQKIQIQDAVAEGFSQAVSSKEETLDYVCKIWVPKDFSKGKNQ